MKRITFLMLILAGLALASCEDNDRTIVNNEIVQVDTIIVGGETLLVRELPPGRPWQMVDSLRRVVDNQRLLIGLLKQRLNCYQQAFGDTCFGNLSYYSIPPILDTVALPPPTVWKKVLTDEEIEEIGDSFAVWRTYAASLLLD